MEIETIEKILNFLETKDGKEKPEKWCNIMYEINLAERLKTHPDGSQYKHHGDLLFNLPILIKPLIVKLPKDLYVTGSFYLNNIQQPLKLPDKLHVVKDFYLYRSNVSELPKYLYVGGNFNIKYTPLADKYTDEEIYEMVASTGGEIIEKIYR